MVAELDGDQFLMYRSGWSGLQLAMQCLCMITKRKGVLMISGSQHSLVVCALVVQSLQKSQKNLQSFFNIRCTVMCFNMLLISFAILLKNRRS
jgi:hypothetical protein